MTRTLITTLALAATLCLPACANRASSADVASDDTGTPGDDTGGDEPTTWYRDNDEDGHGDPDDTTTAVDQPEGYVANDDDCDDTDATVHPGAEEIPDDGIDQDCDGLDDTTETTWYRDSDGDTYGDPDSTVTGTTQPDGYVDNGGDCDDGNRNVNPDATEVCNGIDDDCDGLVDDDDPSLDASTGETWYRDLDEDGYGDLDSTVMACDEPTGYVDNHDDCDDSDPDTFPGAEEIPDDGIDQDCDGDDVCADCDGDGEDGEDYGGDDCDDTDPAVHPGADDICDGIDNDCDGGVDNESYEMQGNDSCFGYDGCDDNDTVDVCSTITVTFWHNDGDTTEEECSDAAELLRQGLEDYSGGDEFYRYWETGSGTTVNDFSLASYYVYTSSGSGNEQCAVVLYSTYLSGH